MLKKQLNYNIERRFKKNLYGMKPGWTFSFKQNLASVPIHHWDQSFTWQLEKKQQKLSQNLLFSVSKSNTLSFGVYVKKTCQPTFTAKICSKFTLKISEWRQWYHFSVFIVNLEQISLILIVFPLLA